MAGDDDNDDDDDDDDDDDVVVVVVVVVIVIIVVVIIIVMTMMMTTTMITTMMMMTMTTMTMLKTRTGRCGCERLCGTETKKTTDWLRTQSLKRCSDPSNDCSALLHHRLTTHAAMLYINKQGVSE